MATFVGFRKLIHTPNNKQFNSEKDVKNEVDLFFSSRNPEFFFRGMHLLVERWQNVIHSNGDYFVE